MDSPLGNEQFMKLYGACEDKLLRYILLMVPQHADALDILQETATSLWRKFDEYDPERPFEAWARKFAHLNVLNHRQQSMARKRDVLLLSDNVLEALAEDHERHAGVLEIREKALEVCLQKLTDLERRILRCRYWTDQTLRELAETLGEPEQRLYHRLAAIRKALQDCINKTLPGMEAV